MSVGGKEVRGKFMRLLEWFNEQLVCVCVCV